MNKRKYSFIIPCLIKIIIENDFHSIPKINDTENHYQRLILLIINSAIFQVNR